jgi:hypothetical protein
MDKEGQFKLQVPASSESGNIGFLVRYANYAALKADEDDATDFGSFNRHERNTENQDIFTTGHGVGYVTVNTSNEEYLPFIVPNERTAIETTPLKLGTAYHDISQAAFAHQDRVNDGVTPPIQEWDEDIQAAKLYINTLPFLETVVNQEVTVGVDAGGRSGTINLDGMLALNIGANTSDRQSLWLDYAGGIVSNVGRDIRGRSYVGTFDGDILVQVGGPTVATDSRFQGVNANRDGAVDIRVISGGDGGGGGGATMSVIRIDTEGVRIYTPSKLEIQCASDMRLESKGKMVFNAEEIFMYGNDRETGRWVERGPGNTIK